MHFYVHMRVYISLWITRYYTKVQITRYNTKIFRTELIFQWIVHLFMNHLRIISTFLSLWARDFLIVYLGNILVHAHHAY